MPSDTVALEALALRLIGRRLVLFRSTIAAAAERARSMLCAGTDDDRAGLELGRFAAGRLDAARFAALRNGVPQLDATSRERIARAVEVFADILRAGDESFIVDVTGGVSLRFAVASALARLGRGFGAVRAVELVRSGRFVAGEHDRLFEWFGFDEWSRVERLAAPPLIIRLDGADLRGGSLSSFIDGAAHFAIVARGLTTAAPLVSLVVPGTLVIQTSDPTATDRFAEFDGPAVLAFVGGDSACFMHDPQGGKCLWQRMRIWRRPATMPRKTVGGISPRQQADALAQLEALAEQPALSDTPVESLAPGVGDPTERLASWLLRESGVA